MKFVWPLHDAHDYSWILHRGQLFACESPKHASPAFRSSVSLMQQIFDQHIDQSFFILRERIFTTEKFSESAWGMMKVVGKRISWEQNRNALLEIEAIKVNYFNSESSINRELSAINAMTLDELVQDSRSMIPIEVAQSLASKNARGEVLHDYDRSIAAVMVSAEGEILNFGVNCNSKNKTLHAEINMLQRMVREGRSKIPIGAKIFSTHKPCKMCAGMIFDLSEDPQSIHVEFLEDVPGSLSRATVLDRVTR